MKKIFLLIYVASFIHAASCNPQENLSESKKSSLKEIKEAIERGEDPETINSMITPELFSSKEKKSEYTGEYK